MPERPYLLFITHKPVQSILKEYFHQFHLGIIEQNTLIINIKQGMPIAILIHWSIIKNNPAIIQQFYTHYPVPLLIINDCQNEESSISLLEMGADDVMTAPLHPRELHAKIAAIARRMLKSSQKIKNEKEVIMFSNWRLHPTSRQIFHINNQELQLSAGEYDLLLTFVQQPYQILDREFLLQITKNCDLNPFDRRIDVQISRLRQKIEHDVKNPKLIKTIRNGGYMFTTHVTTIKEKNDK